MLARPCLWVEDGEPNAIGDPSDPRNGSLSVLNGVSALADSFSRADAIGVKAVTVDVGDLDVGEGKMCAVATAPDLFT